VQECQASLQYRPESVPTQLTLGYALLRCGRFAEARTAWEAVLRLEPGNREAEACLSELQERRTLADNAPPVSSRKAIIRVDGREMGFLFRTRGPVDEAIVRDVCERDVYHLADVKIAPATILDLGAHIGSFAILAAHRWPQARILACEADLGNFALLEHHLKNLAGGHHVDPVNRVVLGEDATETDFWMVADKSRSNSGGGSCWRQEPGAVKIRLKAMSIVKLWRDRGLTSCDLLKIDCEGAEYSIISALRQAKLLPQVDWITGEWHCGFKQIASPADAEAELRRILAETHRLEMQTKRDGREGYFTARILK
jgi:FkbM family methyltransferase